MSSAMTTQRATLIGLLAPLCWGMGVSLVRGIAEGFGLAQGQTLLYTTAAVCLFFVIGIPDLRTVDRRPHFWSADSQRELALLHALYLFFCWRNADDGGGHGELPLARSDTPFCRGL